MLFHKQEKITQIFLPGELTILVNKVCKANIDNERHVTQITVCNNSIIQLCT